MNKRPKMRILSIEKEGAIYDLIDLTNIMSITDYNRTHHKFSRNSDGTLSIDAGVEKERKKVNSISSLTNIVMDMI